MNEKLPAGYVVNEQGLAVPEGCVPPPPPPPPHNFPPVLRGTLCGNGQPTTGGDR